VLLGRPYGVQVLQDGRPRAAFQSCLVTGACPAKLAALEALLHTAVPGPAAAPPRG